MPTSSPDPLTFICNILMRERPTRALDLGTGWGKYGMLIREYCDRWGTEHEPRKPCKLVGVEGHRPYLTRIHSEIYDEVLTIDLRETLQGHALWSEPWDLVLAIDILEHFVESEGVALLTRIKESLSPRGLAIVSTPGNWNPQGAAFGNELERHRSFWSMPRLSEWGIARRVGSQVILIMRGE